MSAEKENLSRRDFFKIAGAVGVGSLLGQTEALTAGMTKPGKAAPPATRPALKVVPKRPFGKTGVKVPILGLGGIFDIPSNQLLLKQALKQGVSYWDTANSYKEGKSEEGMGMYFAKYPDDRDTVFLVTKTDSRDPAKMTKHLDLSLARLKTDYIDLYFLHGIRSAAELKRVGGQLKAWVQKAKSEGKIHFFGFSTHKNMAECLLEAPKLGFIDGIMLKYNFRLMHTDQMKGAVEACAKAGIGLTAMKTQARKSRRAGAETKTKAKLVERFLEKGFTVQQARLKAVWENPNVASICSAMDKFDVLAANVAAALNKTKLAAADKRLLEKYARETCSGYCAGCAEICESAISRAVPVADVMRYLMYHNGYGDRDLGRASFAQLPAAVRRRLGKIDYSTAEARCPQHMPIGELMRQAAKVLA